jgi:hypothetical protein
MSGTQVPAMPACARAQRWLDTNSPAERLRHHATGDAHVND